MKLSIFVILLIIGINVFALNIPDKPDSRVIDQTNTLTVAQRQVLINSLNKIYDNESHTEIQILIIPSLDNEIIEDLSIKIARKWQIGQKNTSNGALILIALKEHKYRVEVGYGLEGVLPDGYIGNLERNVINPYFAKNDFFNGLKSAIDNLGSKISNEYKTTTPKRNDKSISAKYTIIYVLLGIIIFVLIATLAALKGGYWQVFGIFWTMFKIVILSSLFRGGGGNNRRNDDIGGGGGFGGGGNSGKW